MEEMRELSPRAYEDLLQRTDPKHWCKNFFNPLVKCDSVDNNLCEAFKGRILEARTKNIYSMLEEIRTIVMERIHIRGPVVRGGQKILGQVEKKLEDSLKLIRYCHVIWNDEDDYETLAWGTKYVVHIKNLSCDCRAWQITKIPCCHAICALLHKGMELDNEVHNFYKKALLLEAYDIVLLLVRDPNF